MNVDKGERIPNISRTEIIAKKYSALMNMGLSSDSTIISQLSDINFTLAMIYDMLQTRTQNESMDSTK